MIHRHAADAPLCRVAEFYDIDKESVKQMDREMLEEKIRATPKSTVEYIGVDEIAHKKGHHYLTLITDLRLRRAIAIEEGRKSSSLERFFNYLGKEDCQEIKAVVIDRWKPYRRAIKKYCPRALIVYDKFHILQDFNCAVDSCRKRMLKALAPEQAQYLKHSKWAILKRAEFLTPSQKQTLSEIERRNRPLYRAYLLKEELRLLYNLTPEKGQPQEPFLKDVKERFEQWQHKVMYSRIPEIKNFVRRIRREIAYILNYFIHRLTNGLSEGLNSIIKSIKMKARGYKDTAYFVLKIYQKAGVIR